MNKDRFELEIGKRLRAQEASVPPGSWNVIQARLQVQGASGHSGSFGFGAALSAGVALLLGLAAYSALESGPEQNQFEIADVMQANTLVSSQNLAEGSVALIDNNAVDNVIAPEPTKEADDLLSISPVTVQQFSQAVVSTMSPKEPDDLATPSTHAALALVDMKSPDGIQESPAAAEKIVGKTGDDTIGRNIPVNTDPSDAPFTASIRTSGSFGYAPFTVHFQTIGNPSGQVWDFGPYGKSTDPQPTVVFDKPGLYSIMLSAYRGENEQKIEFVTIEVEEGSSLYMPNSFTPDGDGQNDVFLSKGTKLQSFQMTIVNSKGAVVFQSLDIETPWVFDHALHGQDGEFYIAIVRAKGLDGKEYNIRQRLNIIY